MVILAELLCRNTGELIRKGIKGSELSAYPISLQLPAFITINQRLCDMQNTQF